MPIEETVTYLEMTSPDQLAPGRRPPVRIEMETLDASSASLFRSTYERVGGPHGWVVPTHQACRELLSREDVRLWAAKVGGEIAGLLELQADPDGNVEIVVLGLVPEFVGRGFGGHLLTVAIQLAWETHFLERAATRRVWLHTSSRDHPNALPNYEGRGFRAYKTERRQREVKEAP
jgi:GNAT superfamily N-acetyltransferase